MAKFSTADRTRVTIWFHKQKESGALSDDATYTELAHQAAVELGGFASVLSPGMMQTICNECGWSSKGTGRKRVDKKADPEGLAEFRGEFVGLLKEVNEKLARLPAIEEKLESALMCGDRRAARQLEFGAAERQPRDLAAANGHGDESALLPTIEGTH